MMYSSLGNHFDKRTDLSLFYILNYAYYDIQPSLKFWWPVSTYYICTQLNLETYTCRFSGVAAFNFYAVSIFQASFGGGLLNPHLAAVITGTVQLLASALSGLLSDLIGRLPLLLLTSLLMSAALGGFGFYSFYRESITVWLPGGTHSDWIPLLCVLTFVAAFSLGPNPISWLLVGEMYSLGKEVSSGVMWETTFC